MRYRVMKQAVALLISAAFILGSCAEAKNTENEKSPEDTDTRVVTDSEGRKVKIPEKVETIVCLNVGTLLYAGTGSCGRSGRL